MSAMPDLRFFLWAVFVMVAIACLDNVFGVLSHVVLLYSPRFDLLVPSFDLLFLYIAQSTVGARMKTSMSDKITMSEVSAHQKHMIIMDLKRKEFDLNVVERLYFQTLLAHKKHMIIMDLKRKEFGLALIKAANITTNVEVHEMEVSRPKRHKARIDPPNGWFEYPDQ